jgi:hypothetical protein
MPTSVPSVSNSPTVSPTEGMVIHRRVWDPCYPDPVALVGAKVLLKDFAGNIIDEAWTDEEGYYTFSGLPWSRFSVEVIYHECASAHPSSEPTLNPSKSSIPTRSPSSVPSISIHPTSSPTVSPTEGMVIRRRVLDPCYDEEVVLVNATVYLYDFGGNLVRNTTTGSDGYYEFSGLRWSRFFTEVIYPECPSEGPSPAPSSIPSSVISSLPSVSIVHCSDFRFYTFQHHAYICLLYTSGIEQTNIKSLTFKQSHWTLGWN